METDWLNRWKKLLLALLILELFFSFLVLAGGFACIGLRQSLPTYGAFCELPTGIWGGFLFIFSAAFGIVTTKKPESWGVLIAHYILCVVSCVISGTLSASISQTAAIRQGLLSESQKPALRKQLELELQICIAFATFSALNAALFILSSVMLCWKCWGESTPSGKSSGYITERDFVRMPAGTKSWDDSASMKLRQASPNPPKDKLLIPDDNFMRRQSLSPNFSNSGAEPENKSSPWPERRRFSQSPRKSLPLVMEDKF